MSATICRYKRPTDICGLCNPITKMTDTPETDAMANVRIHNAEWMTFARKLERERDEALQLLRDIRSDWGGIVAGDGCDCPDCEFLRPIDALLNKYIINQND